MFSAASGKRGRTAAGGVCPASGAYMQIALVGDCPLWLSPSLFFCGVAMQLVFCRFRWKAFLYAGACLVLASAALDYDLTLAVGQALAVAGLLAWRGKP
jgi:hypothetical protein